jgi:hypothetical protein
MKTFTLLGLVAALASSTLSAAPSVFPTGVTIYDKAKAWNGYTLLSGADKRTYLVDMSGQAVHSWPYPGFPSLLVDPALNQGRKGHVLVQLEERKDLDKSSFGNGVNNHAIAELDWSGKVVWQWAGEAAAGNAYQHHDLQRLANGNTLVLANQLHHIEGFKLEKTIDDALYEVAPDGTVVWRWLASEHLDEFGFTAEQLKLVRETSLADYLHTNNAHTLGPNKWFDAGDQRFAPDNILIDSRQANFLAIIDKSSGKVVWRLGPNYPDAGPRNPFAKGPDLPRPVDQLSGQHDAKIIPEGLPGAGNILLFDNQGGAGYPAVGYPIITGASRVLEIDPSTSQIVWEYRAGTALFSTFTSSVRRLPNGNTLVAEGQTGRVFQVTRDGQIVWEYLSPYFSKPQDGRPASNSLYRATPVPYDWVPAGTAHKETPVKTPKLADFHVPK